MRTIDLQGFLGPAFPKARVVLEEPEFEKAKQAIISKGGVKFLQDCGVSKFTCYQYLSGRRNLPLHVLVKADFHPKDLLVKLGTNFSKPVRIPSLDKPDVCYVSGALRDGWLIQSKGKIMGLGIQPNNEGWKVELKKAFENTFALVPKEYGDDLIAYSEITARFFHHFFQMPLHSQGSWEVPTPVLGGSGEAKKQFIAGFFDAEGSCFVKKNDKRLIFNQNNWKSLYQIKVMLEGFGIRSGSIARDFRTNNHRITVSERLSLKRFAKLIPLRHPDKRKKLSLVA